MTTRILSQPVSTEHDGVDTDLEIMVESDLVIEPDRETTTAPPEPAGGSEFVICPKCRAESHVDDTAVESVHRSAEGLVGYLRCVTGHVFIHQFAEAYPKPEPPPSVIALRNRLAAEE